MYVCLCAGVTDGEIRATLNEGAQTVEEVMLCTGAGTGCGSCVPTIEELITEHAENTEAKSCRRRLEVIRVTTAA